MWVSHSDCAPTAVVRLVSFLLFTSARDPLFSSLFPLRQTGLNDGECTSQSKQNTRHAFVSVVTARDPRPQPPTFRINSQPPTATRHRGGLNLTLDHRTFDLPRRSFAAVLTLLCIASCLSLPSFTSYRIVFPPLLLNFVSRPRSLPTWALVVSKPHGSSVLYSTKRATDKRS